MLPDVAQLAELEETKESMLEQAEQEEWNAKLRTFQLKLYKDVEKISLFAEGNEKLHDFLDFISIRKRKDQAEKAQVLVQLHADQFAPVLKVNDLTEVPAEYAQIRHEVALPGKAVYVTQLTMMAFFLSGLHTWTWGFTVIHWFVDASSTPVEIQSFFEKTVLSRYPSPVKFPLRT